MQALRSPTRTEFHLRWPKVACDLNVCTTCGLHQLDKRDGGLSFPPSPDGLDREFVYIDSVLHYSHERFKRQARAVDQCGLRGEHVLDVGAGGGLFLAMARDRGARVSGIEPNPARRAYAQQRLGVELDARLLNDSHWQQGHASYFDTVCLWELIEHVDDPLGMLQDAATVLGPRRMLFLETPDRTGSIYRAGALLYRLTSGRAQSLLRANYSPNPGGHTQIFAPPDMLRIMPQAGFEVLEIERFHELSFPPATYLRRITGSDTLTRILAPVAGAALHRLPITNKMTVCARKGTV